MHSAAVAALSPVLAGDRDAEALAQRRHVGSVSCVYFVAGVEPDQPLRRDAGHGAPVDRADSGQGLGEVGLPVVRRSVDTASMLVEHDDVEVDLVPGVVAQDEVPGSGVGARYGGNPRCSRAATATGISRSSITMSRSS
jgi:hypothetical protein